MDNLSKQSECSENVYKPIVLTDFCDYTLGSLTRHTNCFDPLQAKEYP